jgi:ATP synthase protein I
MNAQLADARMLLGMQALLIGVVVFLYLVLRGSSDAHAALFGGVCALLNAWLLGRRLRLAADVARSSPGREVALIYIGALQRFALLLALFIMGMGWLKLNPVPLLVAFGVAQIAFLMIKSWPKRAVS